MSVLGGDLPWKVPVLFRTDIESMKLTGKCTHDLWTFLILWRAMQQGGSEQLEGWHKSVKTYVKRAPVVSRITVSARIAVTFGEQITPRECAELHKDAMQFKEEAFEHRLAPYLGSMMASAR